jgi:peptide-N4-(N-acetyl-beta-glucosaminyl)asparagine amidase
MSYCIAFSIDGATDVTRRYVRNMSSHGKDRTRCAEEVLMFITNEIKQMRRTDMAKEDKHRLVKEDQREEREMRSYVVQNLTSELERAVKSNASSSSSSSSRPAGASEIKVPELPARQTGTEQWRRLRGENGPAPGPDDARREGQ